MVRKQMNVNYFKMSYDQMGLIATVELAECDENFVAWQRFLSNGVIALLPLSDKLSSIVWSTDIKNFKYLMQLNDTDFIDAVNNAFVSICQYKYLIWLIFFQLKFAVKQMFFFIAVEKVWKKFRGRNGYGNIAIHFK